MLHECWNVRHGDGVRSATGEFAMLNMNLFVLASLGLIIYAVVLARRLVSAVEQIARSLPSAG
jgi:hypothetical protein